LKALELTKGTQREYLKRYYGSVDLNPERVKKIKGIIKTSGALGFSEKTSRELVEKGKKFTSSKILKELADYIIERER
jgi:geranylgeranyl pyrophosphate synthase